MGNKSSSSLIFHALESRHFLPQKINRFLKLVDLKYDSIGSLLSSSQDIFYAAQDEDGGGEGDLGGGGGGDVIVGVGPEPGRAGGEASQGLINFGIALSQLQP